MFKSPGLVGRVGSGISSLASVLGGAAAAATTYLLQALFGGANQALANTDVLTDEKGDLTVKKTTTAAIDTQRVKLAGNGGATTDEFLTGPQITTAVGKKLMGQVDVDNYTTGDPAFGWVDASPPADANRAVYFYHNATGSWAEFRDGTGGGTDQTFQVSSPTFSAGTPAQVSIVTGGFSSGVPSPSGAEGGMIFGYNGANHELLAACPHPTWGNWYPSFWAYQSGASYLSNIYVPTAADTSVFTPTGYVYDSFTDTTGTAITAHTSDSGASWTGATGVFDTGEIEANKFIDPAGGTSVGVGYTSTSDTDVFIHTPITTANGNTCGPMWRCTDDNNLWVLEVDTTQARLRERTSGTSTTRATATASFPAGDHIASARISGNVHETWVNGGNKLSYTSAVRNTSTLHGVLVNGPTATVNSFYSLPLTSATYDTAFDTSALTADDCDLYHTFDSIPDVTLANGAVIRDGYVDDGSLTVVESGSGSASVTTNALVLTGDATITNTGAYGPSFTRSVGMVLKADINQSTNTTTTSKMGIASGGTIADANRIYRIGNVNGVATWESFNPAGTAADSFTTGLTFDAAAARKVAIVLGGFDSAGVPDATGDYGAFGYYYDGTNWNFVAASSDLNTATIYPTFQASTSAAGTGTWDNIYLPDSGTTVESVFTPTGYALGKFTGTNNVSLTAANYTADAGTFSGQVSFAGSTTPAKHFDNRAESRLAAAWQTGMFTLDSAINHLLTSTWRWKSLASTQCYIATIFRYVDNNNWWCILSDGNDPTYGWSLEENTSGSQTTRASGTWTTAAIDTDYVITVRDNGSVIECWRDGGSKLTYTSSQHNTSDKAGFGFYDNAAAGRETYDNFYALPLTSATYADLDF